MLEAQMINSVPKSTHDFRTKSHDLENMLQMQLDAARERIRILEKENHELKSENAELRSEMEKVAKVAEEAKSAVESRVAVDAVVAARRKYD